MRKGARNKGKREGLDLVDPADIRSKVEKLGEPERYARNRLISKMLQDRSVPRLISAPYGYGKTFLAQEYAKRLFAERPVSWVDASSPSFLAELDRGHMQGLDEISDHQPELLVLDDVPWLHEERAATLSRSIDAALYRGIEVVLTMLPSCDCLSSLQPERIYVDASDMEVTEQECIDSQRDGTSGARAHAMRMWRRARDAFMGKAPALAWGSDDEAPARTLGRFFSEKLSAEAFRASFAIILLGHGSMADLHEAGLEMRDEDMRILARDYPFLGIDPARGRFSAPLAELSMVREALERGGAMGTVVENSGVLLARVLGMLLKRGEFARVQEVLEVFCSDAQCARWLFECGGDLLDKGEFELVDALLRRCPEPAFEGSCSLQVLRAWNSGVLGDERESVYYAQKVLRRKSAGAPPEDERQQAETALAYLALVAFGGSGGSVYAKGEFSTNIDPVTADGFIARVADLCTDVELERAFFHGDEAQSKVLDRQRKPASESRARGLSALFSQYDERLRGEFLYRLAFHVLCHVDSELLRPVVLGIGCELMARSRRSGVTTCTEALVVRDLWRKGFFRASGQAADKRDARLLEDAGRILKNMASSLGDENVEVPWEMGARASVAFPRGREGDADEGSVEKLRVHLFGSFEVIVGDRYIMESEWRKKSRMLVILLVLNQGRDVSRDALFEELWPGMSRVRALDNFYSAWSNACALFGNGPYLERQESFCRVNSRYVVSDVAEFEKLVRCLLTDHPDTNTLLDTYARIESVYRGGLVPSETDNQTINAQRLRYKAMYIDAMIEATDCSLKANDARLALWFARKAMETGEQREDVYYALVRAQIAAGQRCSAIRTYFECRQYLRESLGLDPSCDMQDLYNKLISVDPSLLKLDPSAFKTR